MFKILRNFIKQNSHVRSLSTSQYYITTPIFYVNSSPHLGHVHTLLLADAINIHQRLKLNTNQTIFSSGTDEHGLKIQTAAEAHKIDCQKFCDINSDKFKNIFKSYDTTLTHFTRTTSDEHIEAVRSVWLKLQDAGHIYMSSYSGWYSTTDETFVADSQVTKKEIDGELVHVDQYDNKLIWSEEENYMFGLSKFSDKLCDWLTKTRPLNTEFFNEQAIKLSENLQDLSISRPRSRLSWAIEVPNDPGQTIYVWLDALTNYLTNVGYPIKQNHKDFVRWPIDCQVIGKDIIKFHAIYWPAFLMALSLPLPKKLICHSHWLIDSLKMSKSRGNVVDPNEENKLLTPEGLRYYLLRASTPHSDTDYSQIQALRRINAELADTYGNLLSRCCAPAINPDGIIPTKLMSKNNSVLVELLDSLDKLSDCIDEDYKNANFYKGIDSIMSILRLNNNFYEATKPWKLIKEIGQNAMAYEDYMNLQAITFETLRICSILLQPIVPKIAVLALDRMSVENRSWADARLCLSVGDMDISKDCRMITKDAKSVIFRRISN